MSVKSSLLITLGTLALGAAAATNATAADYYDRCEYIRTLTDVSELTHMVQLHDDCSVVALQRIVDLTQPTPGGYDPQLACVGPTCFDIS